jgi:hypothetical protein
MIGFLSTSSVRVFAHWLSKGFGRDLRILGCNASGTAGDLSPGTELAILMECKIAAFL